MPPTDHDCSSDREVELEEAESKLKALADGPAFGRTLTPRVGYITPMDFELDRLVVGDLDAIASRAASDGYQRGKAQLRRMGEALTLRTEALHARDVEIERLQVAMRLCTDPPANVDDDCGGGGA